MIEKEMLAAFSRKAADDKETERLGAKVRTAGLDAALFRKQQDAGAWFDFPEGMPGGKIAEQKETGRCWAFAAYNFLKPWIQAQYNTDDFRLSVNYIAFYDLLEKSNYFLEMVLENAEKNPDDRLLFWKLERPVADAGQWDFFVCLTKKYGMAPYEAMPDTAVSARTGELIGLLSDMLRICACELMENREKGSEWLMQKKQEELYRIYRLLVICFGEPPQEFARCYVPVALEDYVPVINVPCKDRPFYRDYTVKYQGCLWGEKSPRYLNLPLEILKGLVRIQLADGMPVWFGCDSRMFADKEQGILTPENFDYAAAGCDRCALDKGKALQYHVSCLTHAMVFHSVAGQGKDTRWLAENSYGEKAGHEGYLSISDAWFDRYVYEAVIHRKYLKQAGIGPEGEVITLEPWDPIGALA